MSQPLVPIVSDIVGNIQTDIHSLNDTISNALTTGTSMFGAYSHPTSINSEVSARNKELHEKKKKLTEHIKQKEEIINRSNRDFSDTLPDTQPKKILHFIEDYTLVFLSMSYLFMGMAAMYVYTSTSSEPLSTTIPKGGLVSLFVTFFMGALLYYVS